MENQELPLSIPPEWRERFLIKRIDEEDIEITLEERNRILQSLNAGIRFIQIGKYTLMLNSIKSIDPYYEPNNIPDRPELTKPEFNYAEEVDPNNPKNKVMNQKCWNPKQIEESKKRIELWDRLFKDKIISVK